MKILNNDNIPEPFLFKTDKEYENKVQYLLHIKNQLSFYVRNNILFVDDFKNVEQLETSIKQKKCLTLQNQILYN